MAYPPSTGFHRCGLSERLLYTSFLLLMGAGYLMALAYLYTSHQGHDGKPGLSVEDVATNYYGNRSGTRLEAAIRGPMSGYIDETGRHHIVAWLKDGADWDGYQNTVGPILSERCVGCHSDASGMGLPDFTSYEGVRAYAKVDTGVSLQSLIEVSHIHLFGIGLVLLGIGMIFRKACMTRWLKAVLMMLPFVAVALDISAWFLTKWDPVFAYTVIVAGAMLGLGMAAQILISLYQIWLPSECDPCD